MIPRVNEKIKIQNTKTTPHSPDPTAIYQSLFAYKDEYFFSKHGKYTVF